MLKVVDLNFSYGRNSILEHLNFSVEKGRHLSIIGESGSGKSTLLKLLYGEFDLNSGHIFWKDHEILGPKYNLVIGYEFMKYVAQEFELMPFTSVEENVGKFLSNFFKKEKKARVEELLEVVELTDFANRKVKTLSGGQKQRVALARAMARQPEILLLDEPFSHIDNFKKQSLRRRVFRYLKENQITCVVATHDHEDVLGYADEMLVLHDRKILALESPEKLYKNPKTPLVASFFDEFNMIRGELVYAHQLKTTTISELKTEVVQSYFKGNYYLIEGRIDDQTLFFENSKALEPGTQVFLEVIPR